MASEAYKETGKPDDRVRVAGGGLRLEDKGEEGKGKSMSRE